MPQGALHFIVCCKLRVVRTAVAHTVTSRFMLKDLPKRKRAPTPGQPVTHLDMIVVGTVSHSRVLSTMSCSAAQMRAVCGQARVRWFCGQPVDMPTISRGNKVLVLRRFIRGPVP